MIEAAREPAGGLATIARPSPLEATSCDSPEARLERLYTDHFRMVRGICRRLLRDPTEAEDAAQQTFLSAYRSLLGGSQPEYESAWLATIARNECGARAQARMREPLATDEVEGSAPDVFSEVAGREDLVALREAIGDLPAPQKEAFVLRELGGLSQREISKTLAISESALETLLFRARRRLRKRLEPVLRPLYGAWTLPLTLRHLLSRLETAGDGPAVLAKIAVATAGAAVLAAGVASEPNPARPLARVAAPAPIVAAGDSHRGDDPAGTASPRAAQVATSRAGRGRDEPAAPENAGRAPDGSGGSSHTGRRAGLPAPPADDPSSPIAQADAGENAAGDVPAPTSQHDEGDQAPVGDGSGIAEGEHDRPIGGSDEGADPVESGGMSPPGGEEAASPDSSADPSGDGTFVPAEEPREHPAEPNPPAEPASPDQPPTRWSSALTWCVRGTASVAIDCS